MGCTPSIPQDVKLVDKSWIINNAEIGDMIILSGKGNISNCVRGFSESNWSHVGMIYVNEYGEKFVWESSQDTHLYDHNTRKFKDGPRLVNLREMLKIYEGYFVGLRKLDYKGNVHEFDLMKLHETWRDKYSGLPSMFNVYGGMHYASDAVMLMDPIVENPHDSIASTKEVFCTQLLIETWRFMGIIKEKPGNSTMDSILSPKISREKPSTKYKMEDFTSKSGNGEQSLDFLGWVTLTKEYIAML